MKKQQAGFAPIMIVVLIIVIGVISAAAWAVLYKNKAAAPAVAGTITQAEDTGTNSNPAVDGATQFMNVKEWGVKFALTADTADAYYDKNTSSSVDAMNLRVHTLDGEPDCKTAQLSIAGFFRVKKDDEDTSLPGKKYSDTKEGQTIGDYFYFIEGSQYNCTDKTDQQIILQGVRNGFNTAGSTIQKI